MTTEPKKTGDGSFCPMGTGPLADAWCFIGVRYPNTSENHGLLIALCTGVVRGPGAV